MLDYPEPKLTPHQKLQAQLVVTSQKIPVGFQLGMTMHLPTAIEAVTRLCAEHDLPRPDALLAELERWRQHTLVGRAHAERCAALMDEIAQLVESRAPADPWRR